MMKLSMICVVFFYLILSWAGEETLFSAQGQSQNPDCAGIENAFIHHPVREVRLVVDPRQEVVFDGEDHYLRVLMVESVGTKDRPRLNVMTGLQVLENGKMKSYPHRVSVKMPPEERGMTPRTIRVVFAPIGNKNPNPVTIQIEYTKLNAKKCAKATIQKYKI